MANTGFSSISRTAAGQYSCTLGAPPADNLIVPVTTIDSQSGVAIALAHVSGGVVFVRTVGAINFASGVTSDTSFFIIVSQGSP
ncbi:MAG: hypothetical protein WBV06_03485 [Acidimicrobiia bacterium]